MTNTEQVIEATDAIANLPRAAERLVWQNRRGVIHDEARKNGLSVAALKALVSELSAVKAENEKYRVALELARVRINRLAHVIQRDQNALWNGTQLGPATDDDLETINAALGPARHRTGEGR